MNLKTGAVVPSPFVRKTLTVADKGAFDAMLAGVDAKLASDEEYSNSIPLPADYYCDRSLLAINAEYGKVVTESGEVLLDDESMMNSCDFIGDDNKVLAKTSHYDHAPKETLTYTRGDYKIVGKTVLLNPTDLKKKKDRIFQVTTASYKAVKVGSSSFFLPTVVDGICAIYGAFVNCHFDANANPSITCDKVASRLKKNYLSSFKLF